MTSFIIGIFVGAPAGFFLAALLTVGERADDQSQ